MSMLQNRAEVEALKNVMAKYSRFGDTQNWTEFRKLFTDDMVYSVEAMPRPNPETSQAATIEGLDAFARRWRPRSAMRAICSRCLMRSSHSDQIRSGGGAGRISNPLYPGERTSSA